MVGCFAHHHMTPAEYGLYTHLREVSSKHNYIYKFNDRTLSERFAQERGSSKDTINRLRRSLAKLGFIDWTEPRERAGGKFASRAGRILSHQEWAQRYPGKCERLNFASSELSDTPVSNQPSHQSHSGPHQSHSEPHQSQIEASPVSNQPSHQSQQRDISIDTTNLIEKAKYSSGMALADFFSDAKPTHRTAIEQESQSVPPVSTALQVERASINSATGDLIGGWGFTQKDGKFFSESGLEVPQSTLDILLSEKPDRSAA